VPPSLVILRAKPEGSHSRDGILREYPQNLDEEQIPGQARDDKEEEAPKKSA